MRPTLVIVDDHPEFRSLASRLLTAGGFEVVGEAADGRAAITAARRHRPDVVLLDVQLPDIDGFEVAARLRDGEDQPVVVLISTRDRADYGPRVERCGAQGFIPKAELSAAAHAPCWERPDEMNPRLRLALALVALAGGLVDLALVLGPGRDRPEPLVYLLLSTVGVSWSFVATGLVAWSRRPENRTGALMVAVGLAYALSGLRMIGEPLGFALWFPVATLPAAVLAHLIAVFPDGRATTRLQRVFIVVNYATTVPLSLLQLLLVEPARLECDRCPDAPLGVGAGSSYGEVVLALTGLLEVALALLLLWILATRWRQASGPRRRSLAPVALVGMVLLVLYAIREALLVTVSRPAPFDLGFDLALVTLLMLWPLGFLAGLARTRLDRSLIGDLAVALGESLPPGRLEQALARALHDPSLTLAYWLPDQRAFVDAAGRPSSCRPPAATGPSPSCVTTGTRSPPCSTTPPSTTTRRWSAPSLRPPA